MLERIWLWKQVKQFHEDQETSTYYMHRYTDNTLAHTNANAISSVQNKMSKIASELPHFTLKGASAGMGWDAVPDSKVWASLFPSSVCKTETKLRIWDFLHWQRYTTQLQNCQKKAGDEVQMSMIQMLGHHWSFL